MGGTIWEPPASTVRDDTMPLNETELPTMVAGRMSYGKCRLTGLALPRKAESEKNLSNLVDLFVKPVSDLAILSG